MGEEQRCNPTSDAQILRQLPYASVGILGYRSLNAKESFEHLRNYKHFTSWNEEEETRKSENQLEEWAGTEFSWLGWLGGDPKHKGETAPLGSPSMVVFRFLKG